MNIRFWGVRGSIPAPLTNSQLLSKMKAVLKLSLQAGLTDEQQIPAFIKTMPDSLWKTAGGDTACIEVRTGNSLIILDAGTGIRQLGLSLLQSSKKAPLEAHILLSHTHWDHICGLPFFEPAFLPGNRFTIYGTSPDLETRIRKMQDTEFFPVPLANTYRFVQLDGREPFSIGDVEVQIQTMPMKHPGGSYSYRITHEGTSLVYSTDSEYIDLGTEALRPYIQFFSHADVMIFDAQYTMIENIEKENWGHSNVFIGIDMAIEAGVKKLFFTHHDPGYDDRKLWEILQIAKEYLNIHQTDRQLELYLAVEGVELTI